MEKLDLVQKIGNVDFELTYSCNLDCLHCYNPQYGKTKEFSTNEIVELTKELKLARFQEIHYNGGEPLIRTDIYAILNNSNHLGLKTLLETNATLLDPQQVSGLQNLTIRASIDGSEKIHNIIRRSKLENAYRTTLTNLAKAKELGVSVQINCSVNKINSASIYQMVKEVLEYGLDDIRLRLTMPTGSAISNWDKLKMGKGHLDFIGKEVEEISKDFPEVKLNYSSLRRGIPKFEPKFFIDPMGFV
ncbi:MAG: radical SAM protein, partial [Nanoarchaeota archaeon]|nr:radical SAM protein [Nanoarchaeota archaeon]